VVLILGAILVAIAIGLATGGRLRGLGIAPIRWVWVALVGVALQYLVIRGPWAFPVLLASFACLLAFALANVHQPGFAVILVGLALNALVIAANHGMPVTRAALADSGQSASAHELITDADGAKHRLAGDGTVLLPLADVLGIPQPVGQAVSPGDLLVDLGIGWFVVAAMRRPSAQPAATAEA
jgi:hypothetical protein